MQAICKLENLGTRFAKDLDEAKAEVEALLKQYPDLHGIFLQHWSNWVPELTATIKASGREDVWAASWFMGPPSCAKLLMERGPLWNVQSFSQFTETGEALVNAVAKWHLGHDLPMFISFPLVSVTPDNVEEGWREIFRGTPDATPPWITYRDWDLGIGE